MMLVSIATAEATPTNNSKKKRNKSKKKKQPSSSAAGSSSTAYSGKRGSPEGPAPAPSDNHDCWSSGDELEFHDAQSELPGESHDCHVIFIIYFALCHCPCYVQMYVKPDTHTLLSKIITFLCSFLHWLLKRYTSLRESWVYSVECPYHITSYWK